MTTTRTSRIRRAAITVGGLAAIGVLALPAAAYADTYNAQFLTTNQSVCSSQFANYQARVDGTASNQGAKFRVYKDGTQIAASLTQTTGGYAAEFRTSSGNFYGPGQYSICALNKQASNTFATVRVRTDGEI
jgi:hypothetical protein